MEYACFGLNYDGLPLEDWMAYPHPALRQTHKVNSDNMLWPEFKACMTMGIDPDVMFAKDRNMRALITGGVIASNALENMRTYDIAHDRERESNRK